jgi:hypothetical protein
MIFQYCNLLASKFSKQNMLYYGHSKNDLVLSSPEISSFLLVTTENILDDKIQHFLRPCIFFGIFEIFKFKNLGVSETNLKPSYAWGFRCWPSLPSLFQISRLKQKIGGSTKNRRFLSLLSLVTSPYLRVDPASRADSTPTSVMMPTWDGLGKVSDSVV